MKTLSDPAGYTHATIPAELMKTGMEYPMCSLIFDFWSTDFDSQEDAFRDTATAGTDDPRFSLHLAYSKDRLAKPSTDLEIRCKGRKIGETSRSIYAESKGDSPMSFTERAIDKSADDPAAAYNVPYWDARRHTGSPASFEMVKDWIQNCFTKHDCGSFSVDTKGDDHRPSRLLDLESIAPNIRLVDVMDILAPLKYAALSYCWGSTRLEDVQRTTFENFDARKEQIDYVVLPLTFRHAVTLCRAVGVQLLWIGALCIIQDCKIDRECEISKMGDIYSQAKFTIAANLGADVHAGLFSEAEQKTTQKITTSMLDGKESTIYLAGHVMAERVVTIKQPLFNRAWTLQEEMMSPRVLHCTKGALLWSCRKELLSFDGICDEVVNGSSKFGDMRPNTILSIPGLAERLWYSTIIPEFRSRKLSFLGDKQLTTSGIARSITSIGDSQYVAGLWDDNLPLGLLWQSSEDEHEIAPS